MATLRKQNKGITGTMTDDKGNSTDFSVDDVIDSKDYKANVEKQVAHANKQGRTLIEEEGKDYGKKWQRDKMATYYGWMVNCPPGTREVIITGTFR